jgi:predicted nucleic acid-binding protein
MKRPPRAVLDTNIVRALCYPKFKLTGADREELLADYLPFCTTARMPPGLPTVSPCRDPFDVPFLQLASYGKADYLVTGERDLLDIPERLSFKIVAADSFISTLSMG